MYLLLCPEQDSNADATLCVGQHPDTPLGSSGPAYGYFAMNALILSFDRFFNFFSKSIACSLESFIVYQTNPHGKYGFVADSVPLLCR